MTITLTGCSRGAELAATEVLNHSNCKGAEPGLRRISYAEVAKLQGSTLLAMTGPEQENSQLILLSLSKGRQPSSGYQFQLRDASVSEGTAQLDIQWHTPDPNSVQAQAVTFPCLVIGLERGSFQTVQARDDDGNLLGELKI